MIDPVPVCAWDSVYLTIIYIYIYSNAIGSLTQGVVDTDGEFAYTMGQNNNQGDGIAIEVDDDTTFVRVNHVRSCSKTSNRRRGSKLVSYFDQVCINFVEYYQ